MNRTFPLGTKPLFFTLLLFLLLPPAAYPAEEAAVEEALEEAAVEAPVEEAAGEETAAAETGEPVPAMQTEITSEKLEMISLDDQSIFIFTGEVHLVGTNLEVRCDRLEVLSAPSKPERDSRSTGESPLGRIQKIIATGEVDIRQTGRVATAKRAEVLPEEGIVILTGQPRIVDSQGTVTGERILLYQHERRAEVESGPGGRARVTLPDLPDLGFPTGNERDANEEEAEERAP